MREERAFRKRKMEDRADAYVDFLVTRKVFKINANGNVTITRKFKKHMRHVMQAVHEGSPSLHNQSSQFPLDDVVACSLVIGVRDFLEMDKTLGVSRTELAKSGGLVCFFLNKSTDWDKMKAYLDGLRGFRSV